MILGITGGSGSGKTTLLNVIREQGGLVLDCDAIYHDLLQTDRKLLDAINSRFPGCVKTGQLNRKKLGAIVFADSAALATLNAITHKAVKEKILLLLQNAPNLTAIDAIGLFEGGLAELCQVTVAVTAGPDIRVKRLMARDNITEEYAKSRIAAQHTDAWFQEKCTYTLENNGTAEEFYAKCMDFLRSLDIIK